MMIRPSAALRNDYATISELAKTTQEPIYITKNGEGDLVVMSIEAYERLAGQFELYSKLQEGLNDAERGHTRPFAEAMADIRSRRKK